MDVLTTTKGQANLPRYFASALEVLKGLRCGRIDFVLGAAVAVALVVGAWLGRRLARGSNVRALQAATASVLLATGAWFLFS